MRPSGNRYFQIRHPMHAIALKSHEACLSQSRHFLINPNSSFQSSQLFSTVSLTRLVYSFRLSLYSVDASTLAGDEVLGSLRRLHGSAGSSALFNSWDGISAAEQCIPLDTGQDGGHVVCRAPSVLQDIQAQFSCPVDVWMKHLADEFDSWRLVGVLFFEVHDKPKGSILEGRISRADNDSIPCKVLVLLSNAPHHQ